jgi:hypothetical protein
LESTISLVVLTKTGVSILFSSSFSSSSLLLIQGKITSETLFIILNALNLNNSGLTISFTSFKQAKKHFLFSGVISPKRKN